MSKMHHVVIALTMMPTYVNYLCNDACKRCSSSKSRHDRDKNYARRMGPNTLEYHYHSLRRDVDEIANNLTLRAASGTGSERKCFRRTGQ
jgi:pyruvate formate-lyase activating enzyme-like uncharacterized protein